jgi:mono/diheme cytochrome c family protein
MKAFFEVTGVVAASIAILVTTSSGPVSATEVNWEPAMPRMASSGGEISVERGQILFGEHCVQCHGVNGQGQGYKTHNWSDEQFIPDLTDEYYIEARGDEIARSLDEGLRNTEPPLIIMPAFHYILSAEDQQSVLAYVKTLSQRSGSGN